MFLSEFAISEADGVVVVAAATNESSRSDFRSAAEQQRASACKTDIHQSYFSKMTDVAYKYIGVLSNVSLLGY